MNFLSSGVVNLLRFTLVNLLRNGVVNFNRGRWSVYSGICGQFTPFFPLKDRKLIETERKAQTIFYSLTKEYEKMLKPFFKILDENKILETL